MTEQAHGECRRKSDRPRVTSWLERLRARIVEYGIEAVCGASASISASAARDVPVLSAALQMGWLRALRACGMRRIIATSAMGHRFVCHIGDLAEFPYYYRRAYEKELALCVGWLHEMHKPLIYDLGANVGFFATQLAQMLAAQEPRIYAFEPVPETFAKLKQSVEALGLQDRVHPIQAAVVERPGPVRVNYSERNSLYAQVCPAGRAPHPRVGSKNARTRGSTWTIFVRCKAACRP